MSDFTNITESSVAFAGYEEDVGVDFQDIGDMGIITIEGFGWGEGGWGEGGWGGEQTVILDISETIWTNIDTP